MTPRERSNALQRTFSIRRHNLRRLAELYGPTDLARRMGYVNGSFLTQMIGPAPIRQVSERTARNVEEALGLQAGWMDIAQKKIVRELTS